MFINQWNKLNFSHFNGYKRIAADIGVVKISSNIVLVIEVNILNKSLFKLFLQQKMNTEILFSNKLKCTV
jgi:hypothetical protein